MRIDELINNFVEKHLKWQVVDKYFSFLARSKLSNDDFSIIGNNCIVGSIYHKFGLKFASPTVWCFFFPEEYIRFLENLNWYLNQPLKFTCTTRHPSAIKLRDTMKRNYPIGVLGGDIEVHFLHSNSEVEVSNQWSRRLQRVNLENLFIVFSDSEYREFKEELLVRFEKLPFNHKIFFSANRRENSKVNIFVEDYAGEPSILDSTINRKWEKYFDVIKWLNGEEDFKRRKLLAPLI
jgi:uncharacterized protein (DUF1919 family)